jgi:hypothetical protein
MDWSLGGGKGQLNDLTEVNPLDFPFRIQILDKRFLLIEAIGIQRISRGRYQRWRMLPNYEQKRIWEKQSRRDHKKM